jgi:BirA family biotin operon repressor/biotin-[acetyl-CoA-carboxylase] ligase
MLMNDLSEALLQVLRENFGKPVLNDDLCKSLKATISQVSKQVPLLRKQGYCLDVLDNALILRQAPDCLQPKDIQSYLKTNFIGHDLHYFPEARSEVEAAFDLARRYPQSDESITPLKLSPQLQARGERAFAGNGSVIVTEVATAETSLWSATETGLNLHAAVVLRPGILPARAAQIALVAHVALARVIESLSGIKPQLRWPDELIADKKRLARIQVTMQSNIDKINFLVLGFEVNVNGTTEKLESPLHESVTSMRQVSGKVINRPAFAAALFRELEKWYVTYINKGPEKIIREIGQYFRLDGKDTQIAFGGRTYIGTIEGLDVDGTLLLRTANGQVHRIGASIVSYPS